MSVPSEIVEVEKLNDGARNWIIRLVSLSPMSSRSSGLSTSTGTGVSIAVRVAREPSTTSSSPNADRLRVSENSTLAVSPAVTATGFSWVRKPAAAASSM